MLTTRPLPLVAGDLAVSWANMAGIPATESVPFAVWIGEQVREDAGAFEAIVYQREFRDWVERGRPLLR